MDKKILPVKYPMITSWTWIANTFAVLECYENNYTWLFNNFVQLFCEVYENWVSVHYIPHVEVFSISPLFHSALIPRKIIKNFNINILEFIKNCINEEYYVYCKMDESFAKNRGRFLHELLIYGYDDKNQEVNIADFVFNANQKYTFSKTSYENIKLAYEKVESWEDDMQDGIGGDGGILIYSVNIEYKYDFDKKLLISSVEDYLLCVDTSCTYRTYKLYQESSFSQGLKNVKYGIDIYEEVSRYYDEVQKGKFFFYIQPLHVIYDHKSFLLKR